MQLKASALQAQQARIDEAFQKVDALCRRRRPTAQDADRVDYKYVDHVLFAQQDNNARDIVFSIPEETDFVAERLALYPSFRFVTTDRTANGPDELSYRPCIFTFFSNAYNDGNGSDTTPGARFFKEPASVDCFVQISESYVDAKGRLTSRAYQNMPFPVELVRSGAVNYRPSGFTAFANPPAGNPRDTYFANFEFASAMLFDIDWYFPAGSSIQIKIAPGFASVREDPGDPVSDLTRQNEYRIDVVLEGYKKVRE